MKPDDIIAIAVVAACLLWVGWMAWRRLRAKGGCGCEHCPTAKRES